MKIVVGDKFKECDKRLERVVTVTGFDSKGRVILNGRTTASANRFHEKWKSGGYVLVERGSNV